MPISGFTAAFRPYGSHRTSKTFGGEGLIDQFRCTEYMETFALRANPIFLLRKENRR